MLCHLTAYVRLSDETLCISQTCKYLSHKSLFPRHKYSEQSLFPRQKVSLVGADVLSYEDLSAGLDI